MGILNEWVIVIFDGKSNFSPWSPPSDSVWTYILGAKIQTGQNKGHNVTFWDALFFSFFPEGKRMFIQGGQGTNSVKHIAFDLEFGFFPPGTHPPR